MNYDAIDDSKMSKHQRQILNQAKTIQSMRKQVELLEECRMFYEDTDAWSHPTNQQCPSMLYGEDIEWLDEAGGFTGGKIARETKKKLEELRGEGL